MISRGLGQNLTRKIIQEALDLIVGHDEPVQSRRRTRNLR